MEEDVQGTARSAYRPGWGTCALCRVAVPRQALSLVKTEVVGEGRSEFLELCPSCKRQVELGEYVPVEEDP